MQQSIYSFDPNYKPSFDRQGNRQINMATKAQQNLVNQLCEEKRQPLQNVMGMTYDDASKVIESLTKFYPATLAQIQKIKDLIQECIEYGSEKHFHLPDETLNKLSGGKEGSASRLIGRLTEERDTLRKMGAPTDKQLQEIVRMFYCPDIPFEDFGLVKFVTTGRKLVDNKGVEKEEWRQVEPDEFAKQIQTTMNWEECQQFIYQYQSVMYAWEQTRCTTGQINYIKTLWKQQAQTINPSLGVIFDPIEGAIEVFKNYDRGTSYYYNEEESYPTPYTDMQLRLFSYEEADRYIKHLEMEKNNKTWTRVGDGLEVMEFSNKSDYMVALREWNKNIINNDWNYQLGKGYIEINRHDTVTFEDIRFAKNQSEAHVKEFVALNDLMYAMMAMAGHDVEELKDDAVGDLFLFKKEGALIGDSRKLTERKEEIKDFMALLLAERIATVKQLQTMCERSCDTAQEILEELVAEKMK